MGESQGATKNSEKRVINEWVAYTVYDTLVKGIMHVQGRTEQDGARFHHSSQNSIQFKSYELFIAGFSI